MRALIIDDEEAVRAGLSAHIAWQQLGFDEVATAATAEEALARLEEERPELIISDIRLPGMDGIALCRN